MAGVFAVCEQLCRAGHTPFIPSVDFGVDLMLDNGLRIQVKAAQARVHPGYSQGVYSFDVRKGWMRKKGEIVSHAYSDRNYADSCDFFIFFGAQERRFFVVPVGVVGNRSIWIPMRGNASMKRVKQTNCIANEVVKFEDAWHLLDVNAAIKEVEQQEQVFNG
jgi:hypothetical protein